MSEDDNIETLAGEYVLGTLEHEKRTQVASARAGDKSLDQAIQDWEFKLAPLADGIPHAQPSADLFPKIEKRIFGTGRSSMAPAYWRNIAIAASLAFVVASAFLLREEEIAGTAPHYYAALQKNAGEAAFFISFNEKELSLTVRTIAANPPADKSYELWLVAEGAAPKSMGVVDPNGLKSIPLDGMNPSVVEKATFAISVEPVNGSPTGAPTGPVVYSGKFVSKT